MKQLTDKQQKILDYIQAFFAEKGYPPTVREIAAKFGMVVSGAHGHLAALIRKGYLIRAQGKRRALELAAFLKKATDDIIQLPMLGRVAAGQPVLAQDHIEDYLSVSKEWSPRGATFALTVKGDSMVGAGMMSGDTVIVQKREAADDGEIIVALIEDEAVVKRFRKTKRGLFLVSENPAYEPILCGPSAHIIGRVVGLIRKY